MKNFKGFDYYRLFQDKDGKIKLNDYNDVINARMARMDMLLDNTKNDDINFVNLNKAFDDKFINHHKLIMEDKKFAQDKSEFFYIIDNLDNLSNVSSQDLLKVSLLLSDFIYIERNIILSDQDSDLSKLKELFIEEKASGENYTDEEYRGFADYIDKINNIIKLELYSRINDIKE